jgi:hypothetical protein
MTLAVDPALRERFERDGYLELRDALPPETIARWRAEATQLFGQARDISRTSGRHVLAYRVLTGDVVRAGMPGLFDFYDAEPTRAWVAAVTGAEEIHPSPNLMSAINVNILQGGHRYRWHFDANPYTALLYLSTTPRSAGGELELYPNLREGRRDDPDWDAHVTSEEHLRSRRRVSVRSRAGTLVLIDGSVTYHRVAPVTEPCDRLSVPMVFPPFREEERPAHLDAYLYA